MFYSSFCQERDGDVVQRPIEKLEMSRHLLRHHKRKRKKKELCDEKV